MTHQLFSDPALKAFKKFLRVDAGTKHLRPRGAVDAIQLRRVLARDQMTPFTPAMSGVRGGDNGERLDFKSAGALSPAAKRRNAEAAQREREWDEERAKSGKAGEAEDAGDMPDPDSIRAAVDCIREAMGDEAAAEFVTALHQKWPGVYGEWSGEEGEEGEDSREDDEPPFEATTGTEDADFPATAGRPFGGPKEFPGMPKRYAVDAASYEQRWPEAARIGIANHVVPSDRDNWGRLVEARASHFDNFGRRLGGSPARGSKSRAMAMDTATPGVLKEGYFMAFPDAARIKCL